MERLIEIKTHVTGFCYADKKEGVFVQDVFAKLAAYEGTGLTPEQVEDMKKSLKQYDEDRIAAQQECGSVCKDAIKMHQQIEAQQQEINKFRTERDMEVSKTNKLYAEIRALTADKDEQAGRLEEALKKIANPILHMQKEAKSV